GADELRVLQIPKEAGQLTGQEQPVVDDGPGRQARNVEAIFLAQVTFADRPLRPLADDEQLPFEDRLLFAGGADEHLSDVGGRLSGQWAGGRLIDRHLAPAEQTLTGAEDLVFEDLPAPVPFQSIPRQEHEAYGVLPHRRQLDAELHTLPAEERVRDLDEQAGAVAGQGVTATSAAVLEVEEDVHTFAHDVVRWLTPDICNETDAAGIMLKLRVVQSI